MWNDIQDSIFIKLFRNKRISNLFSNLPGMLQVLIVPQFIKRNNLTALTAGPTPPKNAIEFIYLHSILSHVSSAIFQTCSIKPLRAVLTILTYCYCGNKHFMYLMGH